MTTNFEKPARTALLITLFATFYLTTIPFRFDLSQPGIAKRWERAEKIPFRSFRGGLLSRADAVGNILLFIPLGFFLHAWRSNRRHSPATDLFGTVIAGAAFSLAIEVLQLLLKDRFSSINDVMNNSAGTFAGAWLMRRYGQSLASGYDRLQRHLRLQPLAALLFLLVGLQLAWQLFPYEFSIKLDSLTRKMMQWQHSLVAFIGWFGANPPNGLARLQLLRGAEHFLFTYAAGNTYFLLARTWRIASRSAKVALRVLPYVIVFAIATAELTARGSRPDAFALFASCLALLASAATVRALCGSSAPTQPNTAISTAKVTLLVLLPFLCFYVLVLLGVEFMRASISQSIATNGTTDGFGAALLASLDMRVLAGTARIQAKYLFKQLAATIPVVLLLLGVYADSHQQQRATTQYHLAIFTGILFTAGLAQYLRFTYAEQIPSVLSIIAILVGILIARIIARRHDHRQDGD